MLAYLGLHDISIGQSPVNPLHALEALSAGISNARRVRQRVSGIVFDLLWILAVLPVVGKLL